MSQPCEWSPLCRNTAYGVATHELRGDVPTCESCADKFDLDLSAFVVQETRRHRLVDGILFIGVGLALGFFAMVIVTWVN